MWKVVRNATVGVVDNPDAPVRGPHGACAVTGSPDLHGAVEQTARSARVRTEPGSKERERVGANIWSPAPPSGLRGGLATAPGYVEMRDGHA